MNLNQQKFLITAEMMRVLLVPALRQLTNPAIRTVVVNVECILVCQKCMKILPS